MEQADIVKEQCRSCGVELLGKFCHKCGEKKFDKSDLSFKKIVMQGVDVFTHFDSKILTSLRLLITKPGFLAKEYCEGAKIKYAKPLQLFFLVNVIYFLMLALGFFNTFNTPLKIHMNNTAHSGLASSMVEHRLADKNITLEEFEKKFDAKVNVLSRTLIILIVPIFAFALYLLFINKRKLYAENFIFSLNFLSWLLLYKILFESLLVLIIVSLGKAFNVYFQTILSDGVMSIIFFTAMGIYSFIAVQRFYGESRLASFVKALIIPFIFLYTLFAYRFILFLVTFYTT